MSGGQGRPLGGEVRVSAASRAPRLLWLVLAAHVPVLAAVGLAAGQQPAAVALALMPLALLALTGRAAVNVTVATLASTLGLLVASAVYVAFTGGLAEARYHVFVVLALAALPRDPLAYGATAVAALATQAALLLALPAGGSSPSLAAVGVHLGFVLAAAVATGLSFSFGPAPAPASAARAEEERALCALQEAERLKSELVAVVSHEFRTPLTSILGYASTLDRRGEQMDRATMLTCLHAIERQARRLERIVANLLVASGNEPSAPGETAQLDVVAERVVAGLQSSVAAAEVALDIDEGVRAQIGEASLARVLEHLVDNALKFSAPGTRVRVIGRRAGDHALLEVVNEGTPIGDADLERIFEPFVQADSSDTRGAEGMGLGLTIVRRIVAAHGGRVEARSAAGEVVLSVTLPLAEPVPPVAEPLSAVRGGG